MNDKTIWTIVGVVAVILVVVIVWVSMSGPAAQNSLTATSTPQTGQQQTQGTQPTGQGTTPTGSGSVGTTQEGAKYQVSLDLVSQTVSSGVFELRGKAATPGQVEAYLVPATYLGSKDRSVVRAYLLGQELLETNSGVSTSAQGGGILGSWSVSFGSYLDTTSGTTKTRPVPAGTYNVLVYGAGSNPLLASGTLIVQ